MTSVIYIHGFLSSPQSRKAQISQKWFMQNYPNINFLCPQLSSYPGLARETLKDVLEPLANERVYAIGSSLGGFWSTYLVENGWVEKAVLVNPGVLPHTRFQEFLGRKLKSYYTEDEYMLTQKDIDDLCRADIPTITKHDKFWLMVQKGDETLDYRLAVEKYQNCKQLVEEGGNHSFEGYQRWLPEIAQFFFNDDSRI